MQIVRVIGVSWWNRFVRVPLEVEFESKEVYQNCVQEISSESIYSSVRTSPYWCWENAGSWEDPSVSWKMDQTGWRSLSVKSVVRWQDEKMSEEEGLESFEKEIALWTIQFHFPPIREEKIRKNPQSRGWDDSRMTGILAPSPNSIRSSTRQGTWWRLTHRDPRTRSQPYDLGGDRC